MPSFAQTMKVKVIDQRELRRRRAPEKCKTQVKQTWRVDYVHPEHSQQQTSTLEAVKMSPGHRAGTHRWAAKIISRYVK